jgi:hypothetical protein
MALTVLRHDRIIEGRDAASVWAQVGDLSRIEEWLPVYSVGTLAGEAPAVGNVLFVSHIKHQDPAQAIRLRIIEWVAGTALACAVDQVPGIVDGRFEVRVTGEPPDDTAHVFLGFTGDITRVTGRVVAFEISRRFRQGLKNLAEL